MTGPAVSILARARRMGVTVENRGGRLWVAPRAKLTHKLRADLNANKAAILAALALLARREPAREPEADVDPHLVDASSREPAEAEWRRFWESAVEAEPGVWRDPAATDREALAAIRAGLRYALPPDTGTTEYRKHLALVRKRAAEKQA